jgi:hypothetical protein
MSYAGAFSIHHFRSSCNVIDIDKEKRIKECCCNKADFCCSTCRPQEGRYRVLLAAIEELFSFVLVVYAPQGRK